MHYVMYHIKSDIKGFVCIFVIVDRLTKLLPGLFMIVLLSYFALFYSFNCHIHELSLLIGFFVTFFYFNNPVFCKTNSSGKTFYTRQKIFYAALSLSCPVGIRQRSYQWKMPWHCSRCTWGRVTTQGLVIQVMGAKGGTVNQKNSQGCQLAWRNGRQFWVFLEEN